MAKITNTTKANIHVTTEAGEFVFKAGEALELADERAAMVADKGAVYFTVGELVSDAEEAPVTGKTEAELEAEAEAQRLADAEKAEAKAKADAEKAAKKAESAAPAAVKAAVKTETKK